MRGGEHKPFQTPCPGTVLWGVGPRYQHKKKGDGAVAAVHETTLVNGLPVHGLPSVLECGVTGSGHPDEWDGTNFGDSPGPHGPWTTHLPLPTQSFEQAGTVDLSTCRKRAFKSVQARRSHHGTRPWTTGNGNADKALVSTAAGGSILPFASFKPTVEDMKYLTVAYDLHYAWQYLEGFASDTKPVHYKNSTSQGGGSVSVGPLTGVLTSSLWSGQDAFDNDTGTYIQTYHLLNGAGWYAGETPFSSGGVADVDAMFSDVHLSNFMGLPTANGTLGWVPPVQNKSLPDLITQWNAVGASTFRTLLPALTDFNSYTGSASTLFDGFPGVDGTPAETLSISFSRSATVVSWDISLTTYIPQWDAVAETNVIAGTNFTHCYGTITLSVANPGSAVYADWLYLKSLWDLNDDILYPWRTDSNTGVAPLVTRNEMPNSSPITGFLGPSWVDSNAALYDGSVIGAPLPAGYGWNADGTPQGIFDFRHEVDDWCWPADYPDSPKFLDTFNYGARTPDFLPQNCTQWTEDFNIPHAPAGKFLFFGGYVASSSAWTLDGGGLWGQDWIQTEDTWPSYNFARPAGADRFVFNENDIVSGNHVDAVFQYLSGYSTGTGDTIVVGNQPILVIDVNGNHVGSSADDPGQHPFLPAHPVDYIETWGPGSGSALPTISSGEVWGGQSVGGFYNVTRLSDTTVLLGAKVFNMPTGWTCPSGDMDTAFGRLRFPDCPGILGRVAINSISLDVPPFCFLNIESSPYLATKITASPSYSEQVDFLEADGTVLVANQAVTRVNNSQFTVPNSGATAYAIIAEAKFIVVHGAAAYYWDDTTPKGNLLTAEFKFDYRMRAETQRINEIVTTWPDGYPDCDCSLLGSTQTVPFSEYSDFILTQVCVPFTQCGPRVVPMPNFPSSFPLDSQYGSRWQACVVSAVQDPLSQRPHVPPSFFDPLAEIEITSFAWSEDDGTGQPNTNTPPVAYYAHGPLVEPFLYMPTAGLSGTEAAPSLPTGIIVGFTSPVTNNDSETLGAPSPGGWVPWELHQNLCGCVGSGGRFSGIYAMFTLEC